MSVLNDPNHERAHIQRDPWKREVSVLPTPPEKFGAQSECGGYGLTGPLEIEKCAISLEVVYVAAVVHADIDHDLEKGLDDPEDVLGRAMYD